MSIDADEVRQLAVEWRQVPSALARHAKPVVVASAAAIKDQLREEMGQSAHFKGAAKAISYDILDGGFAAEIGPEKGGAGSLSAIAYFGGSAWSERRRPGPGWQQGPGGGGTVPDPKGALEAEGPRFADALSRLAAELL